MRNFSKTCSLKRASFVLPKHNKHVLLRQNGCNGFDPHHKSCYPKFQKFKSKVGPI